MTVNIFNKAISLLINKEFKRSQISQYPFPKKTKAVYPCITISRETGSGGRLIAQLTAKKLKMKFYNKSFVELVAKNAKRRQEIVKALDERSRNLIEGVIDSLRPYRDKLPESRYFKYLCRTILSLTEKGKAVILGRGANFIVPPNKSLRVRIVAPFKTRLENVIKYDKKKPPQAKNYINKNHLRRKEFIQRYFRKNVSNANYYDLVINTQNIGLEQTSALIIKAFKDKFPRA